jgi:hypothetical protein
VRGYWINNLLERKDTDITKPKLDTNQYAEILCNSNYGQVLTCNKNLFIGWGDVYKVFNSKEEMKNYISQESKDVKVEIHIYDSEYRTIQLEE